MDDRDGPTPRARPSDVALGETGVAPPHDETQRASEASRVGGDGVAQSGTIAARFQTRAELGRGAFGSVHRAFDTVSHDEVAIKIIPVADSNLADRVRREVRAARRVTHPNVVRVHDIVADGATLVISMELVSGQSLERWISTSKRDPDTVIRMAREIAAGVAAAHAAGVIHRDLKPANVMVRDGSGTCLVTDFGIARPMEAEGAMDATRAGDLIGTPLYMAPEQLDGSTDVGAPADVYALGLVFYELATGKRPHSAQSLIGLLKTRSEGSLPDLADVPATLRDIIRRCLAPKPAERFADAGALARAFDGFDVPVPPAVVPRPRRKRRGMIALGLVALVALAGVGALVLRSGSKPAQRPPWRLRLSEAAAGGDDAAWLDRTAIGILRFMLESQGVAYRFVGTNEASDLVIVAHATPSPDGLAVDITTGPTLQTQKPFAHRVGPSLHNVLQPMADDLVHFLEAGRTSRDATPLEKQWMEVIGARSLSAYLLYQRGLQSYKTSVLVAATKLDPTWPHLHAALRFNDGQLGQPPTVIDTPADPARDPFGHELLRLVSQPAELANPARIEALMPESKCPDQDDLCRIIRIRHARLSDEQMVGEAQHLCGNSFRYGEACLSVAAILTRSDNADAADRFVADWRARRPDDERPIVLGAVGAIRRGDTEAARTAVRRLALLDPGSLPSQTAISIAIGDYATAAASATKVMGYVDTKVSGTYELAIVYIMQGKFGAAIGLLREVTADSVTTERDYTFEALIDTYEGLGDNEAAAATIDRWFASPNPPTELKALVRGFQRDLLRHKKQCPRVEDALAKVDADLRDVVGQTLRRLATKHGCLPCSVALADGTGGFHRQSSNVAFGRCALEAGSLDIAAKVLAKETRVMMSELDPGALVSPFSSALAHLYLAEVYIKQGKTADARTELDVFIDRWKDADRPLPQLEHAKQLRAKL
jgi:hypothetical protein